MAQYGAHSKRDDLMDKIIADMHTHSENSHDSVCKIEEMCLSQIEKGTNIFAVTDHFDTASYIDYDVFTPIQSAYDTIQTLNEKYKGKCTILAGVEISEGFWHKEQLNKITKMLPYDVIIGSVHLVTYKELTMAYSKIDFSKLSKQTVEEYVDRYFDDIITMFDTTDFDILAHLTCPLRYIKGKFNLDINLDLYMDKIETILKKTIEEDKALEVNTSSFGLLSDFMPTTEIVRKYHTMGGKLITLGSDAHIAPNASVNFNEAINTVKEAGFKSLYYYKERKPVEYKIG